MHDWKDQKEPLLTRMHTNDDILWYTTDIGSPKVGKWVKQVGIRYVMTHRQSINTRVTAPTPELSKYLGAEYIYLINKDYKWISTIWHNNTNCIVGPYGESWRSKKVNRKNNSN
jgi:hypothetical protein